MIDYSQYNSSGGVINAVQNKTSGTIFEGEEMVYNNHRAVVKFSIESYKELLECEDGLAAIVLSNSFEDCLEAFQDEDDIMNLLEKSSLHLTDLIRFGRDLMEFRVEKLREAYKERNESEEKDLWLAYELVQCFGGNEDEFYDLCLNLVEQYMKTERELFQTDFEGVSKSDCLLTLLEGVVDQLQDMLDIFAWQHKPSVGDFVVFEELSDEDISRCVTEVIEMDQRRIPFGWSNTVLVPVFKLKIIEASDSFGRETLLKDNHSLILYKPSRQNCSVLFSDRPDISLEGDISEAMCDVDDLEEQVLMDSMMLDLAENLEDD